MTDIADPDEVCMNCYSKIHPYGHNCPFCGKVWWRRENAEESRKENRNDTA